MKKQIRLYHIAKIQAAMVRQYEALDDDYPDTRTASVNERAIQHWVSKITDDERERLEIRKVIWNASLDTSDMTYKPICDRLRELGYEIVEG